MSSSSAKPFNWNAEISSKEWSDRIGVHQMADDFTRTGERDDDVKIQYATRGFNIPLELTVPYPEVSRGHLDELLSDNRVLLGLTWRRVSALLDEHVARLTKLEDLRVSGNGALRGDGFSGCPNLSVLDVKDCILIEGRYLREMTALKYLRCSGCPKVSEEDVQWLRDHGVDVTL